jgi:prophage tail gpP-like protein
MAEPLSGVNAVLTVDGASFTGWTDIRVQLGLDRMAGTFDLGITDRYPADHGQYKFKLGSRCTVKLDGQTVITGYVEAFKPSYDKQSHSISVSGRDITGDLVDCCHLGPPVQWKGQTLTQIAAAVCAPFGIPVAAETNVGAAFVDVKYDEGDTVHSFLAKLAKQRGVLLVSYGDGRLVITRAQSRGSGGSLVLGSNIEAGSGNFSNEGRHSRYIVKGQGATQSWAGLTAEETAEHQAAYSQPKGEAMDNAMRRHRPLVIQAEGKTDQASLAERARWEAQVRAGKSRAAQYTVAGWGPGPGSLWRINTTVPVQDEFTGMNGGYLIEKVAYSLDGSRGSTTQIDVVHPDAYATIAKAPTDGASKITLRGMDAG